MCGIIGGVSTRNVVPILLDGLGRLEYRGYDSAGLAVVANGLDHARVGGRVRELRQRVAAAGLHGMTGIAHTRWATHGAPTERNAHPHISRGLIGVVHNGIIENYLALRAKLETAGYRFDSETDTEAIAHLIHRDYLANGGDLAAAVRSASGELEGTYAIAVIAADRPGQLVGARRGSPLVVGFGDGEHLLASDVYALLPFTRRFSYLEDGDIADLRTAGCRILAGDGRTVERPIHLSELVGDDADLGDYRHYMLKEIHEQPRAIASTISAFTPAFEADVFGAGAGRAFSEAKRVGIVACGTSYHAGLIARHWIENLADMPCEVDIASEFRYRSGHIDGKDTLLVLISQSGETADTLGALKHARERGIEHFLAICNVPESSLARQSDMRFMTRAGPEIGVASTKAFTTQLASLYALAVSLALARGRIDAGQARQHYERLYRLPDLVADVLKLEPALAGLARHFLTSRHAFYLGRGMHYPVAMEGALKLKEISYIHAEAYPAGELKHGPLALVDQDMPVVAVVPKDALVDKMKSNMQEVRARGGQLFVFADRASAMDDRDHDHLILLPGSYGDLSPAVYAVPLQLLAYHAAVLRGNDVDKPRNLAKSVTVE
ncbi:MAG TPA: glutamine--fructose-6-phosphate transaminase (isomerizing) [Parasulfuritortus sp.]